MKESFNIVKTKFKVVAPLLYQSRLKDYDFVKKRLLDFKAYLYTVNNLFQKEPITVSTWNTCLLKDCVLPVLTEFFFLQEVIYFYHTYGRYPNSIRSISEYLSHIDLLISHHIEAYSDSLLYLEHRITLSYIIDKYKGYKRRDNGNHFLHQFQNIPEAVCIIAIHKAILKLNKYNNRLKPFINSSCWKGNKQQLAAVVNFLFQADLIDNKKANQQDIARQFAFTFKLIPFNTHSLFYNYQHSSHSFIDFSSICLLNAEKNQQKI